MEVELVLLILSLLFFVSIFADKIGYRYGVPTLLLFLVVGMLFGHEGIGALMGNKGVVIDIDHAQALSTVAMCIILFTGGMDTKLSDVKSVLAPGTTLSTLGVLITCVITGVITYYLFGWMHEGVAASIWVALLIAATMSSTDSASVFSVLRTNGIGLKHDLKPLLELESGANDPMAYVLTTTLIGVVLTESSKVEALPIVQTIVVQLVMGTVLGFALGKSLVLLMRRVKLANESLYPIMVLTACIFIFSVTYYMKGNPYLAVYVGGLIIGNSKFTRKHQTKSFFDGLTWLAQLVMFLMLGLLARPSEMSGVFGPAALIALIMIFVTRPLSVFLTLLPFRQMSFRAKAYISWVGLKGAGPILFALYPVVEGMQGASLVFNVVFCVTLISLVVQGMTLTPMSRWLKLAYDEDPEVETFGMDMPEEMGMLRDHVVGEEELTGGGTLRDLHLPHGIRVVMVRRDGKYLVPHGSMVLHKGDHLIIVMGESDD